MDGFMMGCLLYYICNGAPQNIWPRAPQSLNPALRAVYGYIRLAVQNLASEWVGFNGTSTQFRSLAPSLTQKAKCSKSAIKLWWIESDTNILDN